MAEEKLTTKLELSGEQEYKNGLKLVSAELKAHRAELNLVKSQYEGNANSAEALRAKLTVLEKQHETQSRKVEILSKAMKDAQERQAHYATAAEQARKALDALEASGSATTEELEKQQRAFSEASAHAESAAKSALGYQTQLNNAQAALNTLNTEIDRNKGYLSEAERSADGCATSIDGYGKAVKDAEDKSSVFGDVLSAQVVDKGLSKVIDYAKQAGEALIDLAEDSAQARSHLSEMTGAAGDDLEELYGVTMRVYSELPFALDFITEVVGETNTRLGLTGDALAEVSLKIADWADMTKTAAVPAVDGVADVMSKWEISSENVVELLDKLLWASQYSGASVTDLADSLASNKAQLDLFGYSLDDSIALLANMQREGLNASSILMGMRTAVDKLTEGGAEAAPALAAAIEQIRTMSSDSEAAAYAIDLFGSRSGTELATAIRTGRFEVEALSATVAAAGGTLEKTAEASDTAKDKYQTALNAMRAELAPFSEELYELGLNILPVAQDAISWIGEHLPGVASGVVGVTSAVVAYKAAVSVATIANSAFGASLNATGIGLVVSLIAGATTALAAFALTADGASAKAKELAEELDGVRAAAESADDALVSSATGTLFAAESAETYIQRLEQLEASLGENGRLNDLAAEKQAEYNAAIEALRALLPDVNIELDEQTGRIEGGTAALRDQIAAWKELAITEILQTTLTEKFQAATDAAKTAAEAQRELADTYGMTVEEAKAYSDAAYAAYGMKVGSDQHTLDAVRNILIEYNRAAFEAQRLASEADAFAGNIGKMTDALVNSSSEGVAALISSFAGVTPILDETSATAETAGAETIQNYTDGIEGGAENAKRTAASVGEGAGEALAAGFEDGASRALDLADKLTEALTPTAQAVRTLTDEMNDLSAAFAEQDENGRLSYDTIVDLIDTGYAAALSVDSETGAVRLNAEAYTALASARIAAQIAAETESAQTARTKAMEAEKFAAIELSNRNIELAESYMEAYAAQVAIVQGHEAAISALKDLQANLSSVTAGTWSSGAPASRGSSGSSGTGAKTDTAEDKYAAEKRLLDFERDMDRLADSDYYDRLEQLVGEYLTENSEKWMSETAAIYKGRKSLAEAAAKDAEDALKAQQKAEEDARKAEEDARKEAEEQAKADAEAAAEARREQYENELADLDYFRELGLVSEAEYYEELRRIRDEYCERESEEWRKHTVELYDYLVDKANDTVSELADAAAKAFAEDEAALAEHVAAKKALIEEERDALVAAKNEEIEAINAEIAARKRAREDAEAEDELAAKRRAVEAAKEELAYARTDEDRIQLEREVARLEEQLADAIADREFELWEREQNDKIAALEDEAAKIEAAAAAQIALLESEEANAAARIETQRRQHAQYLAALSRSAAQQVEAAYAAAPTSTVYNTTNNNSSPTATININPQVLTGAYLEERIKRVLEELSR